MGFNMMYIRVTQVSSDGRRLRRRFPVEKLEDVDERTIYVVKKICL